MIYLWNGFPKTKKEGFDALFQCESWSERELNPRHVDFQSTALPTELPDQNTRIQK